MINIETYYKTRQNNLKYKAKIAKFQHEAERPFDIGACKSLCSCPKELKAMKGKKVFLVDQQSVRKMIVKSINRKKKLLNCKKEAKGSNYISIEKPSAKKQKKVIYTLKLIILAYQKMKSTSGKKFSILTLINLQLVQKNGLVLKRLPKLKATKTFKTEFLSLY